MGVDVCHYYGYGVIVKEDKIKEFNKHVQDFKKKEDYIYSEYSENSYHDEIDHEFSVVYDGMCEEYIFLGKIFEKSHEQPFTSYIEVGEITPGQIIEMQEWLLKEFNTVVSGDKIKFYFIPHFH